MPLPGWSMAPDENRMGEPIACMKAFAMALPVAYMNENVPVYMAIERGPSVSSRSWTRAAMSSMASSSATVDEALVGAAPRTGADRSGWACWSGSDRPFLHENPSYIGLATSPTTLTARPPSSTVTSMPQNA